MTEILTSILGRRVGLDDQNRLVVHGRVIDPNSSAPIIAAIGTSSVGNSYYTDANQSAFSENGWMTWMARLCPQVRISLDHMFGFAGGNSTDMLANAYRVVAASPKPAACLIGITPNDITNPLAGVTSNYLSIARMMLDEGVVPVFVIQHPRTDWSANLLWRQSFLNVSRWVRQVPFLYPGIEVIDISAVTADLAATSFAPISGIVDDTVHLNLVGNYLAAKNAIKPVIDKLFPYSADPLAVSADDIWSTDNPYGSMISNPTMLGSSAGMATGYAVTAQVSSVATPTKFTAADGSIKQRLTVSGTPSGDGYIYMDGTLVSGALASLVPGDKVEMAVGYSVSGNMTGFRQVAQRWTPTVTGFPTVNYRDGFEHTGTRLFPYAHSGILRSPPQTVLGPVTAGTARFLIDLVSGQTCDYVVDIGPFTLRKLPV